MQGGARQAKVDGEGREEDEIAEKTQAEKMQKDKGELPKQAEAEGKEKGVGKGKKRPQLVRQDGTSLPGKEGETESSVVRHRETWWEEARKEHKRNGIRKKENTLKKRKKKEVLEAFLLAKRPKSEAACWHGGAETAEPVGFHHTC